MKQPNYLWQIGIIADGSATVTGVVVYNDGSTARFSISMSTTAHNAKYWLENATGGSKWGQAARIFRVLQVAGANIYINAGSRSETDGDWIQAPTSSDEKIAIGSYYESPIDIEVTGL